MPPAPVKHMPLLIFYAVIYIETGTKNGVILWQNFRNQFRLIDLSASLPTLFDFLQAYNIGTFYRQADPVEVNDSIQTPTELDIVTDDFHLLPPLLVALWG
jgi:hypothetical protein